MKPPTLGHLQRSSFSLTIAQVWASVARWDSSQLWSRPCSLLQGAELAVVKGAVGAISASGKSVFLYWCRRVRGGGKYSWLLECASKGGGCHDVMMLIVNSIDNVCSRVVGLVFLLKAAKWPHPDQWNNKIKYSAVYESYGYNCAAVELNFWCCFFPRDLESLIPYNAAGENANERTFQSK